MTIPPVTDHLFNQRLAGVYGEFGAGTGVSALYLQTALQPAQLDDISLISDIEGSERWHVRDLFQRDVDLDRVTDSLLPYLASEDKVKFFNPLTLTPLPWSSDTRSIESRIPELVATREHISNEGKQMWKCLTNGRHYRVRWIEGNPEYGVLEWSSVRTRLVAIDGQHRLSGLKRLWRDQASAQRQQLLNWRIPVVVVAFRPQDSTDGLPSLVEVVRKIFVYINTTAQPVSPARRILLSDESPSRICTQEILERSHENDLLPRAQRDPKRVPLLCYDWRGKERHGRADPAPAAITSVVELQEWMFHHILRCEVKKRGGESDEFSTRTRTALGIVPPDALHAAFTSGSLDHRSCALLRQKFRSAILPALEHLLQNFVPFTRYVESLRAIEHDYREAAGSDLARHAFDELRFGSSRAEESVRSAVATERDSIVNRITEVKAKHITGLIDHLVGMRGVMAAFGRLRERFDNPDWSEYGERFVRGLNLLYDDGWLGKTCQSLRHIVVDHTDSVVNYRHAQVTVALGAYLELLVAAYGVPWPPEYVTDWDGQREVLLETLENTVLRGFKKQVRPELKDHAQFRDGGKPLTDEVNRRARLLAARQNRNLRQELVRIEKKHKGC